MQKVKRFVGSHPQGAHARHGRIVEYWLPEGASSDSTEFHRDDGPAVIYADGSEHWFRNGKTHRDGGPAVSMADGSSHYYALGARHREDGPAIEGITQREWQTDGVRHRDDGGPAVITESRGLALYWYLEGEQHRDDGPALVSVGNSLEVVHEYWLEGQEVDKEMWRQHCDGEPDLRIWNRDGWLSSETPALVSSAGLTMTPPADR